MPKESGKVAKRYARALFELCPPAEIEAMSRQLHEFAATYAENAELRAALLNPAIPLDARLEVVRDLTRGSETVSNFISLVLSNNRLGAMAEIARTFADMVAALKKLLALEVISAFPLAEGERAEIKGRVEKEYGSLATLSWQVDRDIVGGLVIRSGDLLLDGSVRGALERAKSALVH